MRRLTYYLYFSLVMAPISLVVPALGQNIEVKAYKTRLSDVMDSIATQSKKKVVLNTDLNPLISFGSKELPLNETLKKLENLYNFKFELVKDEIVVTDKVSEDSKKGGRGLASLEDVDPANLSPEEQRASGLRFRTINMNHQEPGKVIEHVKKIVGEQIKFLEIDDKNKGLLFYGDERTYRLIRQIVEDLDVLPPQILLSTRMVEVNKNFNSSLGISLERNAPASKGTLKMDNVPGQGNIDFGYKFGIIDSVGLNAILRASETRGDSKTISNPQVMTSDDVAANLSSDTTVAVKVTSTGTGGGATTAVEKLTAGLGLKVTPKILRDGRIRLKLQVDNGEIGAPAGPDDIPEISNTAVDTEMILRTGQTAAIAGLYKQVRTNTDDGVPLAMNVPLLGWLFKNNSKVTTDRELMVFITPSIIETPNERSISLVKEDIDLTETKKLR